MIPGTESAGPSSRDIHCPDDGIFAPNMAKQLEGTVDQYPPGVRRFALVRKDDARFDGDLCARFDEVDKLLVAEAFEEADSSKLARVHQIVPR
ncbi:hypothetical protein GCM10027404_21710 [Arthrobacter tumbae]